MNLLSRKEVRTSRLAVQATNATGCGIRIYSGTVKVDHAQFDVDMSATWAATIERTAAWPEGAATAKCYCSNGGPLFHIGGSNSFTFVNPVGP